MRPLLPARATLPLLPAHATLRCYPGLPHMLHAADADSAATTRVTFTCHAAPPPPRALRTWPPAAGCARGASPTRTAARRRAGGQGTPLAPTRGSPLSPAADAPGWRPGCAAGPQPLPPACRMVRTGSGFGPRPTQWVKFGDGGLSSSSGVVCRVRGVQACHEPMYRSTTGLAQSMRGHPGTVDGLTLFPATPDVSPLRLQFTPDKKHKPRRLERNSVLPAFLTCPSSAPAAGKTELVQLRPVLT